MPPEVTDALDETEDAPVDMRRADAIRIERARQRLSQLDVAQKANVSQPTVSKAELGRGSDETYAAIAKALGIELPEAGQ